MEEKIAQRIPEFIIFTGPMFGSKTTRMLAIIDRYRYQNRNVVAQHLFFHNNR